MKMKYIALPVLLSSIPALAQADTEFVNKFYGEVQGQIVWQDNQDYQGQTQLVRAGASGLYTADHFKVKYEAEVQYSDNFDNRGQDDIQVTIGRALFITDYGTFVLGKAYSGVYAEVYKRVDIHYSNNGENSSRNKMLWEQATYGTNVFAYSTPRFKLGNGTIKVVGSVNSPKDDNNSNFDVTSARVVYNSKNFNASAGYVGVNEKMKAVEAENRYDRYSVGADYTFKNLTFVGLAEITDYAFNNAENTYAAALKYKFDQLKFGVSYQHKTYTDNWTGVEDTQSLVIASVGYEYSQNLTFFAEGAFYGEEPALFNDSYSEDSLNIGIRVKI